MRTLYFVIVCLVIIIVGLLSNSQKYRGLAHPKYHRSIWINRDRLKETKKFLRKYKWKYSHYPTNDEGLFDFEKIQRVIKKSKCRSVEFEKIQDLYQGLYLDISEAGLLSGWSVPFIYENRRGLDEKLFEDSPATLDTDRVYSIEVDKDIYVYSVGAMTDYKKKLPVYEKTVMEMHIVKIVSATVLVFFVVLFVLECRKYRKTIDKQGAARRFAAMILIVVSISLGHPAIYYCEEYPLYNSKDPVYRSNYFVLLEKYKERGVIKEETVRKIKKALEEEKP
jgi:hypothetical protein